MFAAAAMSAPRCTRQIARLSKLNRNGFLCVPRSVVAQSQRRGIASMSADAQQKVGDLV